MKPLLLALLLLGSRLPAATDGPLSLQEVKGADNVQVWAQNSDRDAVRWVWVELAAADNVLPDFGLPRGFVLQPQDRRLLFTLRPRDPSRGFAYGLRSRSGEGDPERQPDPHAVYLLPWAHGEKHTLVQGYFGRATHQGLRALDFEMPTGTPVEAARAGVVIRVKQDSDRGGMLLANAADGNVIEVLHDDATWAIYAHLRFHGSEVQVGQRVQAGELLGYSGATGMASGPHLHFAVYRAAWDAPQTIATVFQTGVSSTASLEEGRTYYAWHPGGPDFVPVLGEDLKESDYRGLTRSAGGGGFKIREERVDRRNIVWGSNGSDHAVEAEVDMDRDANARCSQRLPYQAVIPAHTEAFLFFVDFVGEGASSYRLRSRYRSLPDPR